MSPDAAGIHLTVISYPSRLDPMMESAALQAHGSDLGGDHRFFRAQDLDDVPYAIANVPRIHTLDLVGHGGPGWMRLGDHPLYGEAESSWTALTAIAQRLRPTATIRLLGCITALYPQTQEQLRRMAAAAGRTLVGTLASVGPDDFGPNGLIDRFAQQFTFSSTQKGVGHYPLPHPPPGKDLDLPGYVRHADAPAIAAVELRLQLGTRTVHLACGNRVFWISGDAANPPRTYLWVLPGPAPSVAMLRHALGAD